MMSKQDWRERVGGFKFSDQKSRKIFMHLELSEITEPLNIQVYCIGLQIAAISPKGDVQLLL